MQHDALAGVQRFPPGRSWSGVSADRRLIEAACNKPSGLYAAGNSVEGIG
jgi:hypothetical protein